MSTLEVPSQRSSQQQQLVRLSFTLQAPSLRLAVHLAAELEAIAADAVRVHPPAPQLPGRRDWTVTLTTPPLSLTPGVIQALEREVLVAEHRWPGSRFLGWRTCPTPTVSIGERDPEAESDADGVRRRPTQRELVTASLLRSAPGERRGTVHGRGAPR